MADVAVPRRGQSTQDYMTPREFVDAVEARFGKFTIDLAASTNNICDRWIGKDRDSLEVCWATEIGDGMGWLNPPFAQIDPWALKCRVVGGGGRRIILLTPASLGAEWFVRRVQPSALTLVLRPRLTFVGETTPYPKDLAIHLFGFGMVGLGTWRWAQARTRNGRTEAA